MKIACMKRLRLYNSENDYYCSVKSLLSSRLLSLNVKIKIYRTVIMPVVLCVCETWSPQLREAQSLTELENRVLRKTFGP